MWAAVLAVALNMLGGLLLRASHPPAAATTLLVALGGFKTTVHDAVTVIVGVLIVAIVGEVLRRIRLGQTSLSGD
jgi:CBS-domain-containing membrane protein